MISSTRKLALTIHISVSVGWIGAVLAYLVLVVAAMAGEDLRLRAAWIAMEFIGWYLLVPFAFAALATGIVMALGTAWGLFRHYWVLLSLGLTVVATVVLLQHMQTVSVFARIAADRDIADVRALRDGLRGELLHAGIGVLVLFVIEVLNVYKPRGMTAYGRRKVSQVALQSGCAADVIPRSGREFTTRAPRWVQVVGFHAIGLALLFVIMHVVAVGLRHH
jgi:hypothetical protein